MQFTESLSIARAKPVPRQIGQSPFEFIKPTRQPTQEMGQLLAVAAHHRQRFRGLVRRCGLSHGSGHSGSFPACWA